MASCQQLFFEGTRQLFEDDDDDNVDHVPIVPGKWIRAVLVSQSCVPHILENELDFLLR